MPNPLPQKPQRGRPATGINAKMPHTVRLSEAETDELKQISKQTGRSFSNCMRYIYLLGLKEFKAQHALA